MSSAQWIKIYGIFWKTEMKGSIGMQRHCYALFTGEDDETYKKKEIIAGICSCQHPESTWNIFN